MPRLLQIALLGNSVLNVRAAEVIDPLESAIQSLIDDLFETMFEANAMGLAAPQAYQSVRVFVMCSRRGVQHPDAPEIPPFEVINPEIVSQSDDTVYAWEACLSMPGYKGKVSRPKQLRARWLDRNGVQVEQELNGRAARIFLHELDHLDGKMFLERMDSIRDLISDKEMARQSASQSSAPAR